MKILRKGETPRYERDNIISHLLVSEKTCGSKNLTTTIVEMQPGGIQKMHSHGPEQMYYVLEGEGVIIVGNETEIVGAGDCIFIPSNAPHGLENKGMFLLRYFSAASPSFGREETERFWPLNSMKDEQE
jgi:mannose-6-phosphate isomerase-like protein (cupin superfamily)